MTYKALTATLAGRGALLVAALAVLALAVFSVAPDAYAQSPPPAPTDLTASASSGGITLSWTAPDAGGVTGYQILRRLRAEGWVWSQAVYVDDTGDTATSYTDADVEAGEEYHYRVKARYGDKIGRWSNGVNVRAAEDAPPPTPDPTPEPTATPEPVSLSDDAALSRLELSGIPFAFDPATYTYDVDVGYGIEQTVITAQTSHPGASYEVAMVWADEYEDGVVTLAVGANTIVLAVTAEDGETTSGYTVTVTRAEEPEVVFVPKPPPASLRSSRQTACDALWCATLTVGHAQSISQGTTNDSYGWDGLTATTYPNDALTDTDFDYSGQTYGLAGIHHYFSSDSPTKTLILYFSDGQAGDIATSSTRAKLYFHVEGRVFNLGPGDYDDNDKSVSWTDPGLTWADGDMVDLKMYATPEFKRATVDGETMTLTFDLPLDEASEPDGIDFTVNVDGSSVSVSNVDVSGKTAILTLVSAVTIYQTATVNYNEQSGNPLQGRGGPPVAAFVNQAVTNDACPIWCAKLTVDEQTGSFGWSSGPEFAQASLTDDRFNFAGNEYQLDEITFRDSDNLLTLSFSGFNAGDIDSEATRIRLAVDIEGVVLNLGEGTYSNSVSKTVSWTQDVGWSDGQTIKLQIVEVLGPVLSISASASPIKEARNARATFTVTRSHLTSGYTTAHLGWSRTGNYFNCDYCGPATDEARQNEGELPTSPVFHPGETTRTVSFRVHDDYEFELPGSVTLFLKPPTTPGNEYEIDPAGQSATVEVHSHGRRGGPLGFFGDQFPPILARMEIPPVPEADGQYRVSVHLRMAPRVTYAGRTYTARIAHMGEDMPTPPSFSFTISTRGQLAHAGDDYDALSHAVFFQSRECSPPTVVNDCWQWDGQTWRNTHAVDVTSAITSNNLPAIVSDGVWENHEYLDIVLERSPGLYGSIRYEEGAAKTLPVWIMDTGPAGDPGLTADWTPTGVDLAWDDAIWSATMQVGYTRDVGAGADVYGWDAGSIIPDDSLSDMRFDHAGQTYEVDLVTTLVVPGATTLVLGNL